MEIRLKSISKAYDKSVLKNFSAVFSTGITLISGDSGVGKTTLIRIMAGLEKNFSGEISGINDKKISMLFPENRLITHLSSFDNVNLVASNNEKTTKYLSVVGLSDASNMKIKELSTGMKRRVSLARAFAFTSDILLLDEPFKGLDDTISKEILKEIVIISKKKPVIIVTHKLRLFSETKTNEIITL